MYLAKAMIGTASRRQQLLPVYWRNAMPEFSISAKTLGKLAMPTFCERCFWICQHMEGQPPFSVFPGIFNHIDGYTKHVVHSYFDEFGKPPPWLSGLGDITGYISPPTHRTFRYLTDSGVTLTGTPDAVFTRSDGTLVIGDYKTAWPNGTDDPLYPIYRTQLNAYAVLADKTGLGKVSSLALIYTAPCTGCDDAKAAANLREQGFALAFKVHIHEVPLDTSAPFDLIAKARTVYDAPKCPEGRGGCADCRQINRLVAALNHVDNPWEQI